MDVLNIYKFLAFSGSGLIIVKFTKLNAGCFPFCEILFYKSMKPRVVQFSSDFLEYFPFT